MENPYMNVCCKNMLLHFEKSAEDKQKNTISHSSGELEFFDIWPLTQQIQLDKAYIQNLNGYV